MTLIPVTHYPTGSQRPFALNRERVQGQPYVKHVLMRSCLVIVTFGAVRNNQLLRATPFGPTG
jgi:hypothetical protein